MAVLYTEQELSVGCPVASCALITSNREEARITPKVELPYLDWIRGGAVLGSAASLAAICFHQGFPALVFSLSNHTDGSVFRSTVLFVCFGLSYTLHILSSTFPTYPVTTFVNCQSFSSRPLSRIKSNIFHTLILFLFTRSHEGGFLSAMLPGSLWLFLFKMRHAGLLRLFLVRGSF